MSEGCVSGQTPVPGGGHPEPARPHSASSGGAGPSGRARVERLVTSGTFSLDGGTWEVENNVWIVGDDEQCIVVDPAHDAAAVAAAVGIRDTRAILLTHGHDDHIGAALEVGEALRTRLLTLPEGTEVLTGHGESTTIGAETPHLQEWIARGH
jgi:phosphoribosyl 1,2-cyclic phosphodiesterase